MSPQVLKWVINIGSFLLAGVLLYLALRKVDFGAMAEALRQAHYGWLIPLILLVYGSDALRAWRWQMLLDALPTDGPQPPAPVSLMNAFYSLQIGYMVNSAVPRVGELVRSVNLASREDHSVSGVVGTVVIERVLDVVVLALVIAGAFLLLLDRPEVVRLLLDPIDRIWASHRVLIGWGLAVGTVVFGLGVYWLVHGHRRHRVLAAEGISSRVGELLASFRDGILTLFRSKRRLELVGSTVAIWICYWMMVHIPFLMLDLVQSYGLTLADSWVVLAFGTIGITIFPSPGGTGSYHYAIIMTLVVLFSVNQTDAATYAVLNHAALTLLHILGGLVSMALQGSSLQTLRADVTASPHNA